MPEILYAARAARDLRAVPSAQVRRIRAGLDGLAAGSPSADTKALTGHAPYLRLRVGDWRIIYRPAHAAELPEGVTEAYIVARIINRRDLERAVKAL